MRTIAPHVANVVVAAVLGSFTLSCAKVAAPHGPSPGDRAKTAEANIREGDRLLVRRASLRIETSEPSSVAAGAEEIAKGAGGYVEGSSVQEDRDVVLTLRVSASDLERVLDTLGGLGKVKERTVSSEDVTEEAVDLEARLQNLLAARDRLKKHLHETRTVKDVVAVEKELTRVQGDIDVLEARLKHVRSKVELATITVYIERRMILGPLGYVTWALWWSLKKLFVLR